jgi:small subunit ribosomal protein S3
MGHKVHPIGFRIGVHKGWQSNWYADKRYTEQLHEDLLIRRTIRNRYPDAGISLIEMERAANQVTVTVHTSRPGIVIGRAGQRVDELRSTLEGLTGKRVRLNIQEIRFPELDAYLVAKNVAEQLERRVGFRRALKQTVTRTLQRGAQGIKIAIAGRLGGAEMSRREKERVGRVPLHTLRADIDYGMAEARTTYGRIGVKVWIYKGDILPGTKEGESIEKEPSPATLRREESVEAAPAPTEAIKEAE